MCVIFFFLRNCQNFAKNTCATLHSHLHCIEVPVFPHPHQHLSKSGLFSFLNFYTMCHRQYFLLVYTLSLIEPFEEQNFLILVKSSLLIIFILYVIFLVFNLNNLYLTQRDKSFLLGNLQDVL